jgi:hypothetical protein
VCGIFAAVPPELLVLERRLWDYCQYDVCKRAQHRPAVSEPAPDVYVQKPGQVEPDVHGLLGVLDLREIYFLHQSILAADLKY